MREFRVDVPAVIIVNNNKTELDLVQFCLHTRYNFSLIVTHPISKNIETKLRNNYAYASKTLVMLFQLKIILVQWIHIFAAG